LLKKKKSERVLCLEGYGKKQEAPAKGGLISPTKRRIEERGEKGGRCRSHFDHPRDPEKRKVSSFASEIERFCAEHRGSIDAKKRKKKKSKLGVLDEAGKERSSGKPEVTFPSEWLVEGKERTPQSAGGKEGGRGGSPTSSLQRIHFKVKSVKKKNVCAVSQTRKEKGFYISLPRKRTSSLARRPVICDKKEGRL